MSSASNPSLSSCGCCQGTPALSLEQNVPGLQAISYRVGTYATFLQQMLAQIHSVLPALTTRSADDPSIALLDAWAVVADILTFYQERIANEGYLRTATERLSVLQLARAIGYELKPGVAASGYLAFTVEDVIGTGVPAPIPQTPKTPSAPTQGAATYNLGSVLVPAGSQVQSIPPQGALPQTFETAADLAARTAWNILLPRLTRPADFAIGADRQLYLLGVRAGFPAAVTPIMLTPADAFLLSADTPPLLSAVPAIPAQQIYLAGTSTNIQIGDRLLLVGRNSSGQGRPVVLVARNVTPIPTQNLTAVGFADNPAPLPFAPAVFPAGGVPSSPLPFNQTTVERYVLQKSIYESDVDAIIRMSNWDPGSLAALANFIPPAASNQGVFTFAARAGFFGNNAPLWNTLTNPRNGVIRGDSYPLDWDIANRGAGRYVWTDSQGNTHPSAAVYLERAVPQLVDDGWIVVESPGLPPLAYQISSVTEQTVADYGMSTRTTGLTLKNVQGIALVGLGTPSARAFPGQLAAGLHINYITDVVSIGSDGNLYLQWNVDGVYQPAPVSLGGALLRNAPSMVINGPSPVEVFAVGSDGALYHVWWNPAGWSAWFPLGGSNLVNSPSAVVWAANFIDVFAIGVDGNLYHFWFDGLWLGPENLGGAKPNGPFLINSPTGIAGGPSPVEVFMVASDGNLYHSWWSGAWNGPQILGGYALLQGSPAVISKAVNELDVFAIGTDGNLYHCFFTTANVWEPANPLAGGALLLENVGGKLFVNSPSVVNGAHPLDIFAVGSDGNLYQIYWDGAKWNGPFNLGGGTFVGSPSATSNVLNKLEVFVTASDGNLYHNVYNGSAWSGFSNLGGGDLAHFPVRTATARVQSGQQTLAEPLVADDIPAASTSLMLNGMVLGLQPGQPVAISGNRADAPGVAASEIAILQDIVHNGGFTTLEFSAGLQYSYSRPSLTLNANVVNATNGATIAVPEILGNGAASQANQTFQLKRSPLTYISSATASGAKSSLQVRVNNLLWQETPSLYGLGPTDQKYMVRLSDPGAATLTFGDGVSGSRLPTGSNNITATYRTGIGTSGNVAAATLSILQSRPPGLRGVVNPLAASGGADPEDLDSARSNAPLAVLTLDRIVSLEDYQDFAAAFAGIGKALALPLAWGQTTLVYITIAGIDGASVDPTSQLYLSLSAAIANANDPVQQFRIASYTAVFFNLTASVIIDPQYVAAGVLTAVNTALLNWFAFSARAFAQPVTAAETIAAIQAVPGVIATNLSQLYRTDDSTGPSQTEPNAVLAAAYAQVQNGVILPAELLLLNPIGFSVTEKIV